MDLEIYHKHSAEIYGVLCLWTEGDPKTILRTMVEDGGGYDGSKALLIFARRFDAKTAASLLRSYLEVVTPKPIKSVMELSKGVHDWEAKVTQLNERYREQIGDKLKLAILVGMLPQEYKDLVLQMGAKEGDLDYEGVRDCALGIANQKKQLYKPGDHVNQVEGGDDEYWEDLDIDAISRNITCYACHESCARYP